MVLPMPKDNCLKNPILYSFRRCPYCIRAHMALKYSGQNVILRSVLLSKLPIEVLAVSPQATVPVFVIDETTSMDESWDIMKWALQQNDPDNWLGESNKYQLAAEKLIWVNDNSFKQDLDQYKYAERFPEHTPEYYRARCENFLEQLNTMLEENKFLLAECITIADVAVFPFIRQLSMVDKQWFDESPYRALQTWLRLLLETVWFRQAFIKHDLWQVGDEDIYL